MLIYKGFDYMKYKGCPRCGRKMPLEIKGQCEECKQNKYKSYKELNSLQRDRSQAVYSNPQWQKVRYEVIKRAKGLCEVCHATGKFVQGKDVHHIIKIASGDYSTHYDMDNLVYLCVRCHKQIEGLSKKEILEYINSRVQG